MNDVKKFLLELKAYYFKNNLFRRDDGKELFIKYFIEKVEWMRRGKFIKNYNPEDIFIFVNSINYIDGLEFILRVSDGVDKDKIAIFNNNAPLIMLREYPSLIKKRELFNFKGYK